VVARRGAAYPPGRVGGGEEGLGFGGEAAMDWVSLLRSSIWWGLRSVGDEGTDYGARRLKEGRGGSDAEAAARRARATPDPRPPALTLFCTTKTARPPGGRSYSLLAAGASGVPLKQLLHGIGPNNRYSLRFKI
jgi:hypothetical protein